MFKRKKRIAKPFERPIEKTVIDYNKYFEKSSPHHHKLIENIEKLSDQAAYELATTILYEWLILQRSISCQMDSRLPDPKFQKAFSFHISDALHNLPCHLNDPEELKRDLVGFFDFLHSFETLTTELSDVFHPFRRMIRLKKEWWHLYA